MSRAYGPEEKAKLEKLINEGGTVLREIDDLKESLKATVKSIAEELDVKPAIINKAIKLAYRGKWEEHNDDFQEVEAILSITNNI